MNQDLERSGRRAFRYLRGIVLLLITVLTVQLFVVWQQKLVRASLDHYIELQEQQEKPVVAHMQIICDGVLVSVIDVTKGEEDPTETTAAWLARAKSVQDDAETEFCD